MLKNVGLISTANAEQPTLNKNYALIPVNPDGTVNVNVKAIDETVDVNINEVDRFAFRYCNVPVVITENQDK